MDRQTLLAKGLLVGWCFYEKHAKKFNLRVFFLSPSITVQLV